MKLFSLSLALMLALLLPQVASAGDGQNKELKKIFKYVTGLPMARNYALYTLISARCNRYVPFPDNYFCREAVGEQIKLLDYDIYFLNQQQPMIKPTDESWSIDSFVFVAFKAVLIDLLSDPLTGQYLEKLNRDLNDYLTGDNPNFNLWEMSLKFYKSPVLAARTIGVLFQDTSLKKLHIAYLENARIKGKKSFFINLEKLSLTIDTINLINDYSRENYKAIFYPRPLKHLTNRNIYHFYVPLYMAMKLSQEGTDRRFALLAPIMQTLSYEFITIAPDYRYLIKDPAYIEGITSSGTLRDIFTGLSGAQYAFSKVMTARDFDKMMIEFDKGTAAGVKYIVQSTN
jgi:hypothetical protein